MVPPLPMRSMWAPGESLARSWKTAARTAHIQNHCLAADGTRNCSSSVPGTRLVGDITYLPTRQGWCYLAVVLDLAMRGVGWAPRATLKTDLAAEIGMFPDREAATEWVGTYIEGWYNRRRPHTVTGGQPRMREIQRRWDLTPTAVHTS